MATLVLQTAGSLIGGALGGPIGAAIGAAIGGAAGAVADQSLLGGLSARGARRISYGPRLKDLDGVAASEGAPIPRLYGRARLGGQIIWATRFEEQSSFAASRSRGGKGGVRARPSIEVSYSYFGNVAVGLCEGPIAFVRRVWVDGKLLDLTGVTMRVHAGEEDQPTDPLIVAKQAGAGSPAYRGLAYVVFERLPLEPYGNRLPQFMFEVVRPVHGLCRRIRAVNIIPGAGEHVYEPAQVAVVGAFGASTLPNRTQLTHVSDWHASIDALQALCPNLERVALVISWFGDDLRAGQCSVRPLTEPGAADAQPHPWSVAGLTRTTAGVVSTSEGRASFGGTPSDGSVMRAIHDLKARGLAVTLYPFIMMDIPAANDRADPWTGDVGQPAYAWRGRITCDPAPGRAGSPDGGPAAAAQVESFFGGCEARHFAAGPDGPVYSGPSEWTLSRLVLHIAALGEAAGGVEAVVIGSELIGLTRVRGPGEVNPAVSALKRLAAETRALCRPGTKITYAADWTEYGADARDDGAHVDFPLDPLWADGNIDAVAIDWYPPMTDWRDGASHLDAALFDGPHDRRMFAARVVSGEAFDWYYASSSDRIAQARSPITDGAYGKPWTFRPKVLAGWWSSPHYKRVGGSELAEPTAWTPAGKPVWLMELGCPAVDRGANGPNVFPDPKSAEGGFPPFSRGSRDDVVQKRLLEAVIDHFDDAAPGFGEADNPVSPVFGERMLDVSRIHLWAWDARPFPAFPMHGERWADADNFQTGHWLNGRLEGAPIDDLLQSLLDDLGGVPALDIVADGVIDGYVLDRPMSARTAIEPLSAAFAFDARFSGGGVRFVRNASAAVAAVEPAMLAESDAGTRRMRVRAQDSELPTSLTLSFTDSDADYRRSAVVAAAAFAGSRRDASLEIAAGMRREQAAHVAQRMLAEARAGNESLAFQLPPSRLDLEPGDRVESEGRVWTISRITDGRARVVEAVSTEPSIHLGAPRRTIAPPTPVPTLAGPALPIVLDLPLSGEGPPVLQRLAVAAEPWPGGYDLWRSTDGASFEGLRRITTRATVGAALTAVPPGPLWRIDRAASIEVALGAASLESVGLEAALAGANALVIEAPGGGWELIAFTSAELLAARRWRLSGLVRGLGGSEPLARIAKPPGSRVVILDGAVIDLAVGLEWLARPIEYRLSPIGSDHGDPLAVRFSATAGGAALAPLAPVRLSARRESAGVRLHWIRRTRMGGDNWELAEVPLNEETEAYAITILDGASEVRRLSAFSPTVLYGAAEELADFGGPQAVIGVRVAQIGAATGPGQPAQALLAVV